MSLLPLHRAHDYRALMTRWRALATRLRVRLQTLTEVQGVKIHWLETRGPSVPTSQRAVYLSSGVHGDEAAAAWGLLVWAEENEERLREGRFLIFPCLNPHGLVLNTRLDHRGLDLNRRFHLDDDEICGPWRQMIRNHAISVGLCLHEDYDAQGCYVYELGRRGKEMLSPKILAGIRAMPADPRTKIDNSRALAGVIRRSRMPKNLPGLPEALILHQLGSCLTLTFETPSEFSFDQRVRAQVEFVNAALSAGVIPGNTEE